MHSTAAFPVRGDFFAPLRVTELQVVQLRAAASSAIQHALSRFLPTRTWRASDGTTLTNVTAPNKTSPTRTTSQAVGIVNGTYTDLVGRFVSKTREEYFNVHKTLFNFTCDAHVLHTVSPSRATAATSSLQHEAIKWAVYELFPLPAHADSCHYEATGQGVDGYGRPYAFHVVVPASFPEVPELLPTKRTIRLLSTQVVITRPNEVNESASDVFVSMQTDFRSSSVHQVLSTRICANLQAMSALLMSPRYSPWGLKRGAWVQQTPPSCCTSCLRVFSMLRGRRSCVVCRRSLCRKCVVKASDVLQAPPSKPSGHDSNADLCTPCGTLLCGDATQSPSINSPLSTPKPAHAVSSPTRSDFSTDAPPFDQSPQRKASADLFTPPHHARFLARDRVAHTRSTAAKRTSCLPSAGRAHTRVFSRADRPCVVHDNVALRAEDEKDRVLFSSVLFTVETSEMTRVAATETDLTSHKITAGLLAQKVLLEQMQFQITTQCRRTTQ